MAVDNLSCAKYTILLGLLLVLLSLFLFSLSRKNYKNVVARYLGLRCTIKLLLQSPGGLAMLAMRKGKSPVRFIKGYTTAYMLWATVLALPIATV